MTSASAPSSALLLAVQANVAPEEEAAFNDWYATHVPHLLQVPGYLWGRRYQAVFGSIRYLALYAIADRSWLPALLGAETNRRPAIVNAEFERFGRLRGLRDVTINVYEQISGPPFAPLLLERDYCLSLVQMEPRPETEAEFNRWYDASHVPALLRVPGYVSGMRFRLVDAPELAWLNMRPRYLALYEIWDEASVPRIAVPEQMSPEARAELANFQAQGLPLVQGEVRWNVYAPLAKHWPLRAPAGG